MLQSSNFMNDIGGDCCDYERGVGLDRGCVPSHVYKLGRCRGRGGRVAEPEPNFLGGSRSQTFWAEAGAKLFCQLGILLRSVRTFVQPKTQIRGRKRLRIF